MLPFASPLTSAAAARWSAPGVPGWVPKGALTVLWAASLVAAAFGDARQCTPVNPAICSPDQGFTWWVVICLATPVLLIWMPLAGCAAGVAFALADLRYDDVTSAKIGFGLQGLACAVVAVWLVRSAAAQKRAADEASAGIRVSVPSTHARPDIDRNWARVAPAAILALLGTALIGWYIHDLRAEQGHLSVAQQVNGRVVSVDDENVAITVDATTGGGLRHVTIGVADTRPYPTGSTTPIMLDPTDLSWSRLVAEPQDATFPASAGLLAFLFAALLALRERQAGRTRRLLWTGDHPALRVWVVPHDLGDALVFPDDGTRPRTVRGRPVARLPLAFGHGLFRDELTDEEPVGDLNDVQDDVQDDVRDDVQDHSTATDSNLGADARRGVDPFPDLEWDAATQDSFGRVWRGEQDPGDDDEPFHLDPAEPEPAVLLGSLHDRGWALLVTAEGVLIPSGPLRVGHLDTLDGSGAWQRLLGHLPFGPWRREGADKESSGDADDDLLPGVPIHASIQDLVELADLPMVAGPPARTRILGLIMLAAALLAAPAALVLVAEGWYEYGLAGIIGGNLLIGGTVRSLNHVRLTHTHLEVAGPFRLHLVPWERLHGARLDGASLALAWEPDMVAVVGPFDADANAKDDDTDTVPTPADQRARAERLGTVMLRLRQRALAQGATGRPTATRLGPVWGLLAVYIALMGLALLVVVRA